MRGHSSSSDLRSAPPRPNRSAASLLLLIIGLAIGLSGQGFAASRNASATGAQSFGAAMPAGQRDEAGERMRKIREIVQLRPREAAQQTSAKPAQGQKTVTIDGKPRTCGELICENPDGCGAAPKCNDRFQRAFDRWATRIHVYVTSGRLGVGNDAGTIDKPRAGSRWRYQDVAAAGLAACFIADRGASEDRFIEYMLESRPDEDRGMFLPFWFAAQQHLCPDVAFPVHGRVK